VNYVILQGKFHLKKLVIMQLVRKFPTFCGYFYHIQLLNPNLSNLNPIQNYTPLYLRSVLIQASNWLVGFLGGFRLSGCLTKTFLAFLVDRMHAAYSADRIFLGFMTLLIFFESTN